MLEANGAEVSEIRLPNQLDDVDGLFIVYTALETKTFSPSDSIIG